MAFPMRNIPLKINPTSDLRIVKRLYRKSAVFWADLVIKRNANFISVVDRASFLISGSGGEDGFDPRIVSALVTRPGRDIII